MKTIEAAEFKAHCLELLDQLETGGLIITKDGKPIAEVIPLATQPTEFQLAVLNGSLRGKLAIKGDIFSTFGPEVDWDAQS